MAELQTANPVAGSLSKAFKQTKCTTGLSGLKASAALLDATSTLNDRKRTYFANERVALCLDLGNRPLKAPRCAPGSSSALESHAGGCEEKQRRGSVGGDYGACEDALRDRQREGEALKGGKGHTAEAHIDATAALPEKYKKLVDIYDALLIAQAILMSRQTCCTIERLKKAGENQCGFSIQISHLQMIKHVFPEGVEWSWVQSSTPRQKVRAAWQPDGRTLKLALGPAASVPDGAPVMRRHSPAMASGAMKASVKKLRAALHAAAASFRAESGTADGEAVPDLELAPLPPLSSHVSSDMDFVKLGSNQPTVEVKAGAPILRAVSSVPEVVVAENGGKLRVASHNRRVTFGGVVEYLIPPRKARRLISDTDSEDSDDEGDSVAGEVIRPVLPEEHDAAATLIEVGEGQSSSSSSSDSSSSSSNEDDTSEEECERVGMCLVPTSDVKKAEVVEVERDTMGLSDETLELLDAMEAEDAARDVVGDKVKAAERKATQALPRTFDMLQALLGSSGPCAMGREEAVTKLLVTASRRGPTSREEVLQMLETLANAAPHYLQLKSASETASGRATLRVNRKQDMNNLRRTLLTMAERASGR